MERIENKEICRECGGKCCKKSGCDYSPRDFKALGINDLYNKLEEGNISIVATVIFKKMKDKLLATPFLYLRARNRNREIVDLLSMKTTCSMLRDDGCSYSYEERPSGGVNLVPMPKGIPCEGKQDLRDLVGEWESYQRPLSRLVKRFTGKSVDEKFREDAEQLFFDVLTENYEGVAKEEITDINDMMLPLAEAFPNEYSNAFKRYKSAVRILIK